MNFMKNCWMYEIRKLVVSETINNQFHFSDVGNKRFGKIKYIHHGPPLKVIPDHERISSGL